MRGSIATGCQATAVRRLGALPTAAISDALDRERIPGALEGLAPLSNDFRVAGPAFTSSTRRRGRPAARSATSWTRCRPAR